MEKINELIKKFAKIEDQDKKLNIAFSIADNYVKSRQFTKAAEYSNYIVKNCSQQDHKEISAKNNYLLGTIYLKSGLIQKSMDYFIKAFNYYEKQENKEKIADCYKAIGNCYFQIDEYDKSQSYYKKAIKILSKLEGKEFKIAKIKNNLAGILFYQGKLKESYELYLTALDIIEVFGEDIDFAVIANNIGEIKTNLNEFSQAKRYFNLSKRYYSLKNDNQGLSNIHINLGDFYIKKGKNEQALEEFKKSLKFAEITNNKILITQAHKKLSYVYEITKNFKKSLEHYKIANETENIQHSENFNNKLALLSTEYELQISKKQADIQTLKNIELKNAYKKLKDTQNDLLELEKKNTLLALTVTANHEINQPLMCLSGNIELLEENLKTKLASKDEKYFREIHKALHRIKVILESFDKLTNNSEMTKYTETTKMFKLNKNL